MSSRGGLISSVVATNGGKVTSFDSGDALRITFDAPMRFGSNATGWEDAETNVTLSQAKLDLHFGWSTAAALGAQAVTSRGVAWCLGSQYMGRFETNTTLVVTITDATWRDCDMNLYYPPIEGLLALVYRANFTRQSDVRGSLYPVNGSDHSDDPVPAISPAMRGSFSMPTLYGATIMLVNASNGITSSGLDYDAGDKIDIMFNKDTDMGLGVRTVREMLTEPVRALDKNATDSLLSWGPSCLGGNYTAAWRSPRLLQLTIVDASSTECSTMENGKQISYPPQVGFLEAKYYTAYPNRLLLRSYTVTVFENTSENRYAVVDRISPKLVGTFSVPVGGSAAVNGPSVISFKAMTSETLAISRNQTEFFDRTDRIEISFDRDTNLAFEVDENQPRGRLSKIGIDKVLDFGEYCLGEDYYGEFVTPRQLIIRFTDTSNLTCAVGTTYPPHIGRVVAPLAPLSVTIRVLPPNIIMPHSVVDDAQHITDLETRGFDTLSILDVISKTSATLTGSFARRPSIVPLDPVPCIVSGEIISRGRIEVEIVTLDYLLASDLQYNTAPTLELTRGDGTPLALPIEKMIYGEGYLSLNYDIANFERLEIAGPIWGTILNAIGGESAKRVVFIVGFATSVSPLQASVDGGRDLVIQGGDFTPNIIGNLSRYICVLEMMTANGLVSAESNATTSSPSVLRCPSPRWPHEVNTEAQVRFNIKAFGVKLPFGECTGSCEQEPFHLVRSVSPIFTFEEVWLSANWTGSFAGGIATVITHGLSFANHFTARLTVGQFHVASVKTERPSPVIMVFFFPPWRLGPVTAELQVYRDTVAVQGPIEPFNVRFYEGCGERFVSPLAISIVCYDENRDAVNSSFRITVDAPVKPVDTIDSSITLDLTCNAAQLGDDSRDFSYGESSEELATNSTTTANQVTAALEKIFLARGVQTFRATIFDERRSVLGFAWLAVFFPQSAAAASISLERGGAASRSRFTLAVSKAAATTIVNLTTFSFAVGNASRYSKSAMATPMEAGVWDTSCLQCPRVLSSGRDTDCVLSDVGSVVCFGDHHWQQTRTTVEMEPHPDRVAPQHLVPISVAVKNIGEISVSWATACAVGREQGRLRCWGSDFSKNVRSFALERTAVPGGIEVSRVSSGDYHTCAIVVNGSMACWGSNIFRRAFPPGARCRSKNDVNYVGSYPMIEATNWVCLTPDAFVAVATSVTHTCGVKAADRSIVCFGDNTYGGLGVKRIATNAIVKMERRAVFGIGAFAAAFIDVKVGLAFSCGVHTSGYVSCWGRNNFLQSTPPKLRVRDICVGNQHACGIDLPTGLLFCWGSNAKSQANGFPKSMRSLQVSCGASHTCAVMDEDITHGLGRGTVVCWGAYRGRSRTKISSHSRRIPDTKAYIVYEPVVQSYRHWSGYKRLRTARGMRLNASSKCMLRRVDNADVLTSGIHGIAVLNSATQGLDFTVWYTLTWSLVLGTFGFVIVSSAREGGRNGAPKIFRPVLGAAVDVRNYRACQRFLGQRKQ